ncbi:hypothetical protein AN161_17075 [Lysinibacillus sp. FJAT-14222]|nr:hypothetical protein AN161_17075 [Lysinibacillus sp. FJAT-14222]
MHLQFALFYTQNGILENKVTYFLEKNVKCTLLNSILVVYVLIFRSHKQMGLEVDGLQLERVKSEHAHPSLKANCLLPSNKERNVCRLNKKNNPLFDILFRVLKV